MKARTDDVQLGRTTAFAAGWALAGTIASRLVALAGIAVLARWLAPADFGLLAFALVYITYVETIADLGATSALIFSSLDGGDPRTPPSSSLAGAPSPRSAPRARVSVGDDFANTTFVVCLGMSAIWLGISWWLAPAVAAFFHQEAGTPILRALAWALPIRALGATHDALAQKALRFRARAIPELGLAAVKAAVAVALAAAGLGIWSLVWGHLAGCAAWTLLAWSIVPWRPRTPASWRTLGPLLTYGRGIVAVNLLAAIVHHADIVVVGRTLGATVLGFYQMASRVPEMTLILLVHVTGKVLFPAFVLARSEERPLADAYLTVLRLVAVAVLPAAAALAFLAEPIVVLLFGPRWIEAAPILRALSAYAALRALGSHGGDVLKALGYPGLLAGLGVLKAMVVLPAIVVGARFGAIGVALGLTGAYLVNLAITVAAVNHVTGITWLDSARALKPALAMTSIVVVLGFSSGWGTP